MAGDTVLRTEDGDHMGGLQLGGSGALDNLGALNSSADRILGPQIDAQIGKLPGGTRIRSVSICH